MEKTESTGKTGKIGGIVNRFTARYFSRIIEINRKYATPKIKMTRMVRLALLGLRIYLIILILILGYKFYTLIKV